MHQNTNDEAARRERIKYKADNDTAVAGVLSIMLSLLGLFGIYHLVMACRNLPAVKEDIAFAGFMTLVVFLMAIGCWADRKSPCWHKAQKIREEERLDSHAQKQ